MDRVSVAYLLLSLFAFVAELCNATSIWPYQSFQSVNLHPPKLKITRTGPTGQGYLFISPIGAGAEAEGPMIMSDHESEDSGGRLIWQGPSAPTFAFNTGELDGKPILVYWTGAVFPDPNGFGFGTVRVLDPSYEQIYEVSLPQEAGPFVSGEDVTYDSYIDLHETFVTERGTVLVTVTNVTQADLTPVSGPQDGWLRDSLFYEIDIKTNQVVFRWSAWEHRDQIPLKGTLEALHGEGSSSSSAFNYFHMNAVSLVGDEYLINSRYYCSAFLISRDGSVVWQLQGQTGGDFHLPADAHFCYQHDARIASMTSASIVLHIHDNANSYWVNGTTPTSSLLLELNMQNKQVRTIHRFQNPNDPIYAISQGNYQALQDQDLGPHVLAGHGFVPKIEEYDQQGNCILTMQFGTEGSVSSYRAYRHAWVGQPTTPPALVGCKSGSSSADLYMSWNGATGVVAWDVYGARGNGDKVHYLRSVANEGFETSVTIDTSSVSHVQVQPKGDWRSAPPKSQIISLENIQNC